MPQSISIACFQDGLPAGGEGGVVVAVDVIRATTTAVTAVASGRRCFPVPSLEFAVPLAARLHDPLLVGELGGNMPYGFDLTNSPAEVARRGDIDRPMLLLSTSGTRLFWTASECDAVYVACLRNYTAQVRHLLTYCPERVLLIGAGSRGEFREEDQLCCAWIAAGLVAAGYKLDAGAQAIVERWGRAPADAFLISKSVAYIRDTGQEQDLAFILAHIDDVDQAFVFQNGEVVPAAAGDPALSRRAAVPAAG
jgi:2-phosphosulfolactate phosphatase